MVSIYRPGTPYVRFMWENLFEISQMSNWQAVLGKWHLTRDSSQYLCRYTLHQSHDFHHRAHQFSHMCYITMHLTLMEWSAISYMALYHSHKVMGKFLTSFFIFIDDDDLISLNLRVSKQNCMFFFERVFFNIKKIKWVAPSMCHITHIAHLRQQQQQQEKKSRSVIDVLNATFLD